MSPQAGSNNSNTTAQDPLAIELANLREHFSPTANPNLSQARRLPTEDTLVDRRSPLPLDNAFVQQTKDQIRAIVETIAALANSPIEPNDFIEAALPKIAQAMGAHGAAVWQELPNSHWRLIGNFQLPTSLIHSPGTTSVEDGPELERSAFENLDFMESQILAMEGAASSNDIPGDSLSPSAEHLSILNAVARERQPILVPPGNVSLVRDRPVNPTQDLLMLAPLPIPPELGRYWLQVVQTPSGGPSSQRGYLRFVAQMADLVGDFFRSYRLRLFERDRNYLAVAEHTMLDLSIGLAPATGMARLMDIVRENGDSEHAFLLRKDSRLRGWRVVAAAGLSEIDRRAEGIELIERAAKYCQSAFPHGGRLGKDLLAKNVDDRDPDLTRLIQTFSATECAWIKPLLHPDHPWRMSAQRDVAVLMTWSGLATPPARCLEQTALITRLGLSSLQIPWWKTALCANKHFGTSFGVAATRWTGVLKWSVCLILAVALLCVPVPIRIDAPAILVPVVQQHVYAPTDAIVDQILVEHGQSVVVGQPLIKLRSATLNSEYDQSVAHQLRNAQRIADLESKLLRDRTLTPVQRDELEGERESIEAIQQIEKAKLERLQVQKDSLDIVSEINGVVTTWDLQDTLKDRPLRAGQWLLSLHQSDSNWILEATLPERQAFEFYEAVSHPENHANASLTSIPQRVFPVKYLPDKTPRIDSVPPSVHGQTHLESMLRVRFSIDANELPADMTLAGATARVQVPNGRGPLAWALSKDLVRKLWTQVRMWI